MQVSKHTSATFNSNKHENRILTEPTLNLKIQIADAFTQIIEILIVRKVNVTYSTIMLKFYTFDYSTLFSYCKFLSYVIKILNP